ncbi:Hypothetical protein TES1_1809 [Thermococcus paralvinellae]|uniref:Uncharacterized protein n=2 Tax=Thermococcus paralvinellae TaxID=582419 RepID=W0I543_9EURY|nr:Hypothetical protein TES1_1809 [Thermococcus paralvinellae]
MLRSGITKELQIALSVELVLFTVGVYYLSEVMIWLVFLALALTLFVFAGKKVELEPGRIILKWGYLRELKKVITAEDVVDVIGASRARHVILAKYMPWLLLVPLGMIIVGVWILLFTSYKFAAFGWLLFGVFQLAGHVFSKAEKNKALVFVLLVTAFIVVYAYSIRLRMALFQITLIGGIMAGVIWYEGAIGSNYLILVTKDGNYLLTYSDENDIKSLLAALGG